MTRDVFRSRLSATKVKDKYEKAHPEMNIVIQPYHFRVRD